MRVERRGRGSLTGVVAIAIVIIRERGVGMEDRGRVLRSAAGNAKKMLSVPTTVGVGRKKKNKHTQHQILASKGANKLFSNRRVRGLSVFGWPKQQYFNKKNNNSKSLFLIHPLEKEEKNQNVVSLTIGKEPHGQLASLALDPL
jgi:hypothetical protein